MKPGYGVAIFVALVIVGEYLWKHKRVSLKKIVIISLAAIAAGAFAGVLVEIGLSVFRGFMGGKVGEAPWDK